MRLAPSLSPRRSAVRAALLVLAVAAGACGGGDDSGWGRGFGGGGRKRVGIALPSRSHPFYQELEAGLRAGARRARYELVVTDANMDPGAAVAHVQRLLGQRVDALV